MFFVLLYSIILLAIPIILIVLFGISLYRYIYAKLQNKKAPGTFSPKEIEKRGTLLTFFSLFIFMLIVVVAGLTALFNNGLAHM